MVVAKLERPAVLTYCGNVSRRRLFVDSRRKVLIGLVTVWVAVSGCRENAARACPASIDEARSQAVNDVYEAALWWWIDRLDGSESGGPKYLRLEPDESNTFDEVTEALRARHWHRAQYWRFAPQIRRGAPPKIDESGTAHFKEPGEEEGTLWIGSVEFVRGTDAKAIVETYGGTSEVVLRCEPSGWHVYDVVGGVAICH